MTDKTRGGRVNKRGQKAPRGGSTSKRAAETQPPVLTSTKQPRGRQRGGRTPRSDTRPKTNKAAKKVVPAPEPKVDRIGNDIVTTLVETHLAFVADGNLASDSNTEVIALNIMDHIIRPENWDPALTRNVLCAACFYFASMVTGKQNSASSVAASISWFWEKHINANPDPYYAWFAKERDTNLMSVSMDEVEQGYALLWDQQDRLEDLVGDYKQSLAQLPAPAVERPKVVEDDGQLALDEELLQLTGGEQRDGDEQVYYGPEDRSGQDEETLAEDEYNELRTPTYDEVDQSELDEFDLYVEENE
ncbi:hypothetical protein CLAFUW4_01692 [Fulvia fulva]|uniref:uncharacterized protein n=1 Tax=Passalora fulva TaxID=5499 RepID=UPI002852D40A|nr:uncharacterized protein CLAFUR5_20131 [Fulvia fulva]KAK4634799.1 hypothetical protein CLAFUR4_01690 [Fulvia fulva]KAK4637953.1 hypothetical protein CLAFUR0_01691 [Fulvia fulva]WMI38763.1 hypothetical protein CLAFUR5_20131 [Fulvia fulva]WPV09707.1 hypothetical protein CLAFUW4_01692 [Fulvia fulva]WPV25165.1 hypothetical protein CLAFUW7_01694 [Fulvia fulva]